jgi:hypothetical protein
MNEGTLPRTYEVTWSMIYEADSPQDAVRQALGDLGTVLAHPTEGPNFFLVSGQDIDLEVVSADEIDRD